MTKERFNKLYGKWVEKLYKDHPYGFAELSREDVADYLGVHPGTISVFIKKGLLNPANDWMSLFNDMKEKPLYDIARILNCSYERVRYRYIKYFGSSKNRKVKRRNYGIIRTKDNCKYCKVLDKLKSKGYITVIELNKMFNDNFTHYGVIGYLRTKGYNITLDDTEPKRYILKENN